MLVDLSKDQIEDIVMEFELVEREFGSSSNIIDALKPYLNKPNIPCQFGCKNLETRCKECGRLACSSTIESK